MEKFAILSEKAREIQEELSAWVQTEDLLRPGEELVFSMRIVQTGRLARRDAGDTTGFQISAQCRSSFQGTFIRPVTVTGELCAQVLCRMPSGKAHEQMRTLLLENSNAPLRFHVEAAQKANQALRDPIAGTCYRLALGKEAGEYCAQLWEVSHE